MRKPIILILLVLIVKSLSSQPLPFNWEQDLIDKAPIPESEININRLQWLPSSHNFWVDDKGSISVYSADDLSNGKVVISSDQIKKAGLTARTESIVWNGTKDKILIYTNSSRVWRGNTKGDYWFFDLSNGEGRQIGKGLPSSSLMFAKFSPDDKNVAYVSKHNLYVETLTTGKITQLTSDGTDRVINGTFDWGYEEELACRDGFRWSPDSRQIGFWRVDATTIRNHLMINNTDSLYPFTIPVEYPDAGYKPSSVKIGVIDISSKKIKWLEIPGEPDNNYLPRMEWSDKNEIAVDQLNRKQNEASFYLCDATTG